MKRIALARVRKYDKTQRDFLFPIMCVHATKTFAKSEGYAMY